MKNIIKEEAYLRLQKARETECATYKALQADKTNPALFAAHEKAEAQVTAAQIALSKAQRVYISHE